MNDTEAARRRKTRLHEITFSEAVREPRAWLAVGFILAVVLAAIYLDHRYRWLEYIHLHIAAYHWLIVFLFVAALPVFGFSVVVCYVIVGSKFGAVGGVAVMALATVVHLLASHWIAKSFLRKRIEAFLARRQHKLPHVPEGENAAISLMTAIVPGLPYFARNYLLALAGVPLRIYFWICLPVYVIRSVLTICASDFSGNLTGNKVLLLAVILIVKVGICAYIIKRLRDKHAKKSPV
jgi:uncharacterized membrane protein YdjX (TVP38/TMEM64 family)